MSISRKLLLSVLSGTQDNINELINIQPDGNKAKAYQVKQVRNIILKYKLGGI